MFLLRTNRARRSAVEIRPGLVIFRRSLARRDDRRAARRRTCSAGKDARQLHSRLRLKLGGKATPEVLRNVADSSRRSSATARNFLPSHAGRRTSAARLGPPAPARGTAELRPRRALCITGISATPSATRCRAGQGFVVRQLLRVVLAYIEGVWRDFDTTPSSVRDRGPQRIHDRVAF